MNKASPGFHVMDMAISIAWYKDFLNFACTYRLPREDPPHYAIVSADGVDIHLSLDRSRTRSGTGFCYIETKSINALYEKYDNAGVIFTRPMEISPSGMKDFEIKDYEGNRISFGEARK